MSDMNSHSGSVSRRMDFNKSACAASIGAGAILAIMMVSACPAFSQAPPPATQTAGDGNVQDDHSYLPPSLRSQIEAGKSADTVKTEAQIHAPAKPVSLRRAARRRVRRESWDYGWGGGRGWGLFGN